MTSAATLWSFIRLLRASRRSLVNASSGVIPCRSARIPFACSITMRESNAVWSWIVRSSRNAVASLGCPAVAATSVETRSPNRIWQLARSPSLNHVPSALNSSISFVAVSRSGVSPTTGPAPSCSRSTLNPPSSEAMSRNASASLGAWTRITSIPSPLSVWIRRSADSGSERRRAGSEFFVERYYSEAADTTIANVNSGVRCRPDQKGDTAQVRRIPAVLPLVLVVLVATAFALAAAPRGTRTNPYPIRTMIRPPDGQGRKPVLHRQRHAGVLGQGAVVSVPAHPHLGRGQIERTVDGDRRFLRWDPRAAALPEVGPQRRKHHRQPVLLGEEDRRTQPAAHVPSAALGRQQAGLLPDALVASPPGQAPQPETRHRHRRRSWSRRNRRCLRSGACLRRR